MLFPQQELFSDLDEYIARFGLPAVDEGSEVHKMRSCRLNLRDLQSILAADYLQVFIERAGTQTFGV